MTNANKEFFTMNNSGNINQGKVYRIIEKDGKFILEPSYRVNVTDTEHGEVAPLKRNYLKDELAKLIVTPEEGGSLESLEVTDAGGSTVPATQSGGFYTFTMPAKNVTVEALFHTSTLHKHDFTFAAKDNVITAIYEVSDCNLPHNEITLATQNLAYGKKDITTEEIFRASDLARFNAITKLDINPKNITLYVDGTKVEDNKIKAAGTYTAVITAKGETFVLTFTVTTAAPEPQQGAGSSIVNAPDVHGDKEKIENKYVGGNLLDINFRLFLSASDFVTQKVTQTVDNVIKYDKTLQEQSDFDTYSSNMFGYLVTHASELSFMQRLLLALFL